MACKPGAGKKTDAEDRKELKRGKTPSAAEERREAKKPAFLTKKK